MAGICSNSRAVAAALFSLSLLFVGPAAPQQQGVSRKTDLFDHPVLAVDPGTHTARIWSIAVDRDGKFAVTGAADRTVRVWSVSNGSLLRTIWIPVGPDPIGDIFAVSISPDGSKIAAAGYTENLRQTTAIYIFDRDSGEMIGGVANLPNVVRFLTFSPNGRYLAATLGGDAGLRVFDHDKQWDEVGRDEDYGDDSYGAAFAPDGRLVTTSHDGMIRLYDSSFHLVGHPRVVSGGNEPRGVAFSPDGHMLAIGYEDGHSVDLLDGRSLHPLTRLSPPNLQLGGISVVAWSRDGHTLFGAGTFVDHGQHVLIEWNLAQHNKDKRLPYCGQDSAFGLAPTPDGRILVASMLPCISLMDLDGHVGWTVPNALADFTNETDTLRVSADGKVISFGIGDSAGTRLRFDTSALSLTGDSQATPTMLGPNRKGLDVDHWRDYGGGIRLKDQVIRLRDGEISRSLAVAGDSKRFFLGTSFGLTAFDQSGAEQWHRISRDDVWAVNATADGKLVVAAYGDDTIRWHRADDGKELLALQVVPNRTDPKKSDWVLWTPEGFFESSPGAKDVLKWVTNHGPNRAATTISVSAIPKLHRPDALQLVLQELETRRALGIADLAAARLAVQHATGSGQPPGGNLYVLAVGLDHFGHKAGALHLDYAVDDARDFGEALKSSQTGTTGLYADVKVQYLFDSKAGRTDILQGMEALQTPCRMVVLNRTLQWS